MILCLNYPHTVNTLDLILERGLFWEIAQKVACLQAWPVWFSEGDSPRGLMNSLSSYFVNQQTKDLQTKASLPTSKQPGPHRKGLQGYHWDTFRKQLHLVMHKRKRLKPVLLCWWNSAKNKTHKKLLGEVQNSHEFVSHLQQKTSAFPLMSPSYHLRSCFWSMLTVWPVASDAGQTG